MEISIFGFDPPPLMVISIFIFYFFFTPSLKPINESLWGKQLTMSKVLYVIELTKYWLHYADFNLNQSVG